MALSPDGRSLVFPGTAADRQRLLWLRRLDSASVQPLAGTDGANNAFWSPDSRFIGFFAQGKLKKIDASGGPVVEVAPEATATGGSWNRDEVIVYARSNGLHRVSASGGTPVAIIHAESGAILSDPAFLSDGRHFLYQLTSRDIGGIYVGSLDPREKPKKLLAVNSNAIASRGHLLFVRDRALMAQPFDETRLELSGTPTVIANDVELGSLPVSASFTVSGTGTLAFRTGTVVIRTQLAWFDRQGVRQGNVGDVVDAMSVELSPDGGRVVVSELDTTRTTRDLWMVDIKRNLRTRFTFDPADDMNPLWSADGRDIFFGSRRHGRLGIVRKPASGPGAETELVTDVQNNLYPTSVSRDGRFLLFYSGNSLAATGNDLWVLPLVGEAKPKVLLQTEFNEVTPALSPDGKWLAYVSNESGRGEIYVAPFPGPGGKWQVSQGGGTFVRWRGDSSELFFLSPAGLLMSAAVDGHGSGFVVGDVKPLLQPRIRNVGFAGTVAPNYDVTPDGQRFLIAVTDDSPAELPITLVVNWPAALK